MNSVDKIIMKKLGDIKPYEKNPRKNDKTVALLKEIIPKVGFNVPILLDKYNVIVKGHARYFAAVQLGLDEVPCVITYADEETIKLDRIADNKISEFSQWVNDELLHELEAINIDFDFEMLGLPTAKSFDMPVFNEIDQPFAPTPTISMQESDNTIINSNESFQNDYPMSQDSTDAQERYRKFLEEQEAKNAKQVNMTSQTYIDNAKERQNALGTKTERYAKVTCDCGYVYYVHERYLRSF